MRALGLSLSLFVVGCAVPPNFPSQEELYEEPRDYNRFAFFSQGREEIGGRVDRGGVLGLEVNIGRYTDPDDHAIRGKIYGLLVNARIAGDRVEGFVGGLPLQMQVSRSETGVVGKGLVYGRNVELSVSERDASASIGRCGLELVRQGEVYVGQRRCAGRVEAEDVELQVGRGFRTWGDAERLAALSLMMFRN